MVNPDVGGYTKTYALYACASSK